METNFISCDEIIKYQYFLNLLKHYFRHNTHNDIYLLPVACHSAVPG
jgi:hypothetical protein